MPNLPNSEGLWLTITELADAKSLGKAAVSERVSKLEAQGLLHTRPGKGRSKLVNLAEFDRVVGETGDLSKELGAETRRRTAEGLSDGPSSTDPSYTREQARNMAYRADLAKLDLDERLGKLVPVQDLRDTAVTVGSTIIRVLEALPSRAEELAMVVGREGTAGARRYLRGVVLEFRNKIADSMSTLAANSPAITPANLTSASQDDPSPAEP